MDRETKKLSTPVGKLEVILKSYLTGGEKRQIANTKDDNAATSISIKLLVVSIGDKTENIEKAMDDLHGKDFDFVLTEIAKVFDDSSYVEKKS